ncbi:MAG: hypothetical protein K2R98_34075 [Gemmataceae bacterium]|nr:hypothetical protein [Gemmataceae bacterium]
MSKSPPSLPDRAAELQLHQRLLDDDPTATDDFATAYLDYLVTWLEENNSAWARDLCGDAAERAILSVLKNPRSYDPDQQTLLAYLRMSAKCDLQSLIAKEQRHHQQRIPMHAVELSEDAGKYLGRLDDPSTRLRLHEEESDLMQSVPPSVLEGLSERELRVLDLMLHRIKKHDEFAVAYEVTDLPLEVQKLEIKRVKGRLQARLKRAREDDERTT